MLPYAVDVLPKLLRESIASAGRSPSTPPTEQASLARGSQRLDREEVAFFDAVDLAESLELYAAVREVRPTHSAEIGFCCGGSGMAILQALEDNQQGTHHACDPYQTSYAHGAGLRNVERAGLQGRLRFYEAFPEQVLPQLPRIQFAFIDASHLYDLSMLDFVLIDKRLDVGGVVAFHDMWMPAMQTLVRYILTNRAYQVYHSPNSPPPLKPGLLHRLATVAARRIPRAEALFSGRLLQPWASFGIAENLALLQKSAEDHRDWRHFQPF